MRRTRPLFQFDPGWLYLVAGLVICGAGILVPAADGLGHLESQVTGLRSMEGHLLDRVGAYEAFLDAVDRQDPELIRRLAATQLNIMPEDNVPVLLCSSNSASITEWIEARVPPRSAPPAVTTPPQTLLRRLASGPHRLWFIGAGVFCVFLGLIIGGSTPTVAAPPAMQAQPAVRPATPVVVAAVPVTATVAPVASVVAVAANDEDPGQLSLFESIDDEPVDDAPVDAIEEAPEIDDEAVIGDVVDEVDDEAVEEELEEDAEAPEEVVADEADEGDEEEEDEEEADAEADDEEYEYEYVDEDGNPVAPEDVEEEDEEDVEYEYVDEDGNPVAPEDVEEEDEEEDVEYEYVDEDGNPVDEDGNPVDEEEVQTETA